MADNLIFPLGFDLESGVQDAIKKGDIALRRIEAAMNRKPIVLKAEVDTNKFQMFSRQFSSNIDGISAKLAQAQRIWNSMSFDVKFDADGNLSRRAQIVFDAFQQLTQASATMGQRLGEINRNLAKSEQDTARAITAEYDKRQRQVNEQIRLKERQAAAEERVRQGQLKGVNAGYIDTQRQVEAVRNLRLQYEAILPMLNAMAQRRYDIKVGIDKQFEADIQRINAEIARLRQSNLQLGAKGDTNAIQANLQAIRQLEAELQRISQQKIDLLNTNKINADISRLRTEISSVLGELQSAERRLASDNSLNAALDAQSQKVLKLHADIKKLDQQFAQLNATGKAYNQDGSFTAQANTLLQQRITLTKQLEQEAITGQQAQIKLEQQLREEKRQSEQAAKNAAKEAERQAKTEAARRQANRQALEQERQTRRALFEQKRAQWQKEQQILNKEAKSIADITAKLQIQQQRLQSANIGSAKFNKIAEEVKRLTADLEKANQKMRELTGQTQSSAAQQSTAVKQVSQEFSKQDSYLTNLLKKTAALWSIHQVGSFLTNIKEVTAQFELQRVSLGAILQDQNKANQLFSEIKSFALKSPVSILDLTKYTKQLAAYKVGYDELFETTKKLTDVSVGLGVSMDRVVLAYGQVRATGHLRASEVRQFTEMGVPIVEELAAKLSKMNGEMVTSAQVMDMISKRAISFDMVKEVFDDMTSAGGIFYNMQEKQGNTLYGLWAKLGDAASVMYEQIGNTGIVNEGMKEAIQMLTELMRNWKAVGLTAATSILPAVAAMAAWKMATKALAKSVATATNERIAAEAKLATAMKGTDVAAQNAARSSLAKAKADEAAAIAAQKNATAQSKLKMGFVSLGKTIASGLGIGIVVMLVTQAIYKFYEWITNIRKLKRELDSIYTETATLQDQSVRNFEFLADKAVKAASGSKEQTDALQELNRTYRDILPQEALAIKNLTRMKGNYDALTQSIKEYIAEQQRQKAESSIFEYYGTKIRDAQGDVRDRFFDQGLSANEVGRFFAEFEKAALKYGEDVWGAFQESMIAAGVKDKKRIAQIWKKEFEFTQRDIFSSDTGNANIRALSEAYANQANELKSMNEQYRESIGNLGKFADIQKRVSKAVANGNYIFTDGTPVNRDTQGDLLDAMKLNVWVKQTAAEIQNNEDIKEAFAYMGDGIKSEWFSIIDVLNSNDLGKVSQINFDAIIASVDSLIVKLGNKNPKILTILNTFRNFLVAQKKEYENMVPSDLVVNRWRSAWKTIANEVGISRQYMNLFLMQSGDDFEAYRKKIKEELTATINNLRVLQEAIAKTGVGKKMIPGMWRPGTDQFKNNEEYYKAQEAEKKAEALKKLLDELDKIELETGKKKKGSKGSKSDTRLQVLQEVAQTLATINKEYDDLAKKEGASKALADIKERFKEVLAYTNELGGKFGLKFDFPTEFKTLQEYRNAILKVMQSLKGLPKGSEKTILDFKTMIGKADSDYLQKQIEKQLKELADKISRTKTAKEFYDKILAQTGNEELAVRITYSVYPETERDLYAEMQDQIRRIFKTGDAQKDLTLGWRLDSVFDDENERINYRELDKVYSEFQNDIIEKNRDTARKLIAEGQKTAASQIESWEKMYAKAKSYEERRTDIINRESAERAKIYKSNLPQDEKDRRVKLSQKKQEEDIAKVNFEEFTKSEDYIKIFENLDNTSTPALKRLRAEMQKLIDANADLSPENMKTLVKAMEDIDSQISGRGFGNDMVQSVRDYIDALNDLKSAKANLKAAQAEYEAQEPMLDAEIDAAKAEEIAAQQALNNLKTSGLATDNQIVSAELRLNAATANVAKAEQKKAKAADKVKKAEQKVTDQQDKQRKATTKFFNDLQKVAQTADQLASVLGDVKDILQISEDSVAGLAFDAAINSLQEFSKIMNVIIGLQTLYNIVTDSNPWIAIAAAVLAVGAAIGGFISANKVRKANKEIERQQELLDELEYTYGRLEKAADKLFGVDYLQNYNQQIENLEARQEAYLKQAQAERTKGKKEDKEKTKEFEDQARETANKIKDLQDDLVSHFTGTDRQSVARDFARSWLEAKASFANTTDAMESKYKDMIKNMIIEGAAARIMDSLLAPLWEDMEEQLKNGDTEGAILSLDNQLEDFMTKADGAMNTLWETLKARGIDMQKYFSADSTQTGISREYATASEQSINGLAVATETSNFYLAYIPGIYADLAAMRAKMETPADVSSGWTDWQQQAMDNYNAIARNTAETVVECRAIAARCEEQVALLRRVIVPRGVTGGHGVQVWM